MISQNREESTAAGGKWHTFTECPICAGKRSCRGSADGSAIWCVHVRSDRPKRGRGWIHRTGNGLSLPPWQSSPARFSSTAQPSKPPTLEPFSRFERLSRDHAAKLEPYAEWRSIPIPSLVAFGIVPESRSIVIPERSANHPGDVPGTVERYRDPIIHADGTEQRFRFKAGAKRGFQYVREWAKSALGTVLIVEGFADVAAAHAAGFIAFSRPTRAANLEPLKELLATLEPWQAILVLCENDPDDPEREIFPRREVEESAGKLANALSRRVSVVSPPPQFKDFNDWWKAELEAKRDELHALTGTAPKLHEFDSATYHAIGRTMLGYLRDQADAETIARNVERSNEFRESEILKAEFERASRRFDDEGNPIPDMDYEIGTSCTFQQVLRKRNEDAPKTSIMGALLACQRWTCPACRRRLLEPKWTIALVQGFANERGVFTQYIAAADVGAWKRSQQREGAKWAIVSAPNLEPGEEESTGEEGKAFGLSTAAPRGYATYFDFLSEDPKQNLDAFCEAVRMAVLSVGNGTRNRITTSKGFSIGERATADDWREKVSKIIKNQEPLYVGTLGIDAAKKLRSESYRAARIAGRDPIDFLMIETCEAVFVLCSESFPGLEPMQADEPDREATAKAAAEIRTGEECKASPRWTAKPSKRWERTGIAKGPSAVRAAAMKIGKRATEVETSAIASMVDAAAIEIPESEQEKFLEIVKRE